VGADAALETAREVLRYAEEELEKAVKTRDVPLYRNAADKAFLAAVLAVNAYVSRKLGVVPKSHSERRLLLRRIGREDLRALYSDVMMTLRDEAFYDGVYNPEEVKYAIEKVKQLLKELEHVQNRK
jgi:HEPN domain-containing protein